MDEARSAVIGWLLEGDPSIRWQVLRDLEAAPERVWRREQGRVATNGWGARLLSYRDSDGRWTPRLYGRKWISTTYSLVLLRQLGLPGADTRAVASCRLFLEEGLGADGGINLSATKRNSDVCVTAMVVALLYWFQVQDPRREGLLRFLLAQQMPDGGWNCEQSAEHGSFHTTCSVLEALRQCLVSGAPDPATLAAAEAGGRDFFLAHRLFRSHRSGDVANPQFLRFSFPPRWHYDVLRGLDYFWSAGALSDDRLRDAIGVVAGKRRADGRWPLQQRWPGVTWFEMEEVGEPSRWNTLRAMRVLEAWRPSI
jgi:hypothetical protein